jgi:hypothetical protein
LRFAPRENHSWGAAKTAVRDARLASDTADVPSVVPLSAGGLAASWTVKRGGSEHARELMVAVSRDGGLSWSMPARPHHDDTDTEHGMATLVPTDADGAFGMCWLDGRAGAVSEYGEAEHPCTGPIGAAAASVRRSCSMRASATVARPRRRRAEGTRRRLP